MKRLDIRGNLISDLAEVSRLTAAPYMQQIWVAGNPFTRTHVNSYRIAIFNFFREMPGFTEDILVDGLGPRMVERRHLVDRVFEKAPVPPSLLRLQSPPPLTSSSDGSPLRGTEPIGRSAKKKKLTRQRVVALDGASAVASLSKGNVEGIPKDSGTDDYRKRLEALREEAGSGWLRVLSESGGLTENGVQNTSGK